jgi:hypothetical protein
LNRDASLKEVLDLSDGWEAERVAPGEQWQRSESPPDDSTA